MIVSPLGPKLCICFILPYREAIPAAKIKRVGCIYRNFKFMYVNFCELRPCRWQELARRLPPVPDGLRATKIKKYLESAITHRTTDPTTTPACTFRTKAHRRCTSARSASSGRFG